MAAAAPCHPGTRWERRACCCAGCPWGSARRSIPEKDEGNRAAALGTSRAGFAPPSQPPDPILTAQVSPRHVRSPPCPVPAPNSAPQPLGGSFPPDRAIWGEKGTNIHVQPSLLGAKTAAKAGLGVRIRPRLAETAGRQLLPLALKCPVPIPVPFPGTEPVLPAPCSWPRCRR